MDIKELFGTNEQLESEGVWFELGSGARIRLARQGNPKWNEFRRLKLRTYRNGFRGGVMTDETAEEIMLDLLAETIILDWEGLTSGGQELKYSKSCARDLLVDLRDFRDFVARASSEMESFRDTEIKGDTKNSVSSSPGNGNGEHTENFSNP